MAVTLRHCGGILADRVVALERMEALLVRLRFREMLGAQDPQLLLEVAEVLGQLALTRVLGMGEMVEMVWLHP